MWWWWWEAEGRATVCHSSAFLLDAGVPASAHTDAVRTCLSWQTAGRGRHMPSRADRPATGGSRPLSIAKS